MGELGESRPFAHLLNPKYPLSSKSRNNINLYIPQC